jgi:PII-like signaling protein
MLTRGPAKKLVIYTNVKQRYHGEPVYEAVVRFLRSHGRAGATVTRAIAGYGQSGKVHEAHLFSLTEDVPMRIEAVDSAEKIGALLPWLYEMVDEGLIALSDVEIIKYTHSRAPADKPGAR